MCLIYWTAGIQGNPAEEPWCVWSIGFGEACGTCGICWLLVFLDVFFAFGGGLPILLWNHNVFDPLDLGIPGEFSGICWLFWHFLLRFRLRSYNVFGSLDQGNLGESQVFWNDTFSLRETYQIRPLDAWGSKAPNRYAFLRTTLSNCSFARLATS